MKRASVTLAAVFCAMAQAGAGQTSGAISGHVRDAVTGMPLAGARVLLDGGRQGALTDTSGAYRIREVRSGSYAIQALMIGYQPGTRDSVTVRSGGATVVDFALQPQALPIPGVDVTVRTDPVLDPFNTATTQRVSGEDVRDLPVTTVEEALALTAGTVGESHRGGRVGQQAIVLDGLGVKNQLDASTGPLGVRLPPDMLTEATLITNGFSARYGQAVGSLVNVVTRDPGARWGGRAAYENDRPFGTGWDYGLDRVVLSGDGPLFGSIGFVGAIDVESQLDADPLHAPAPPDGRDPRHDSPYLLPHNTGERFDLSGKLVIPIDRRHTIRVLALRSREQRLLFDQIYKYDPEYAPGRRVDGTLASVHVQRGANPAAANPLTMDLRAGYFARELARGELAEAPEYLGFGAFTSRPFRFVGEDVARSLDTAAARDPIAGFAIPDWSEHTPWGVPAFFQGTGSAGGILWNQYRELRAQLDINVGSGQDVDFYFGGEVSRQRVEAFQRIRGYLPVGLVGEEGEGGVPPASVSEFSPVSAAGYGEAQFRLDDLAFTAGLRYDHFDPRADIAGAAMHAGRGAINPRLAVSTVLKGAIFVASWGRFSQAPDYQYLVDAAFEDTTRTGRFRRGNPNLGYEDATQYEFSVRARPSEHLAVRVNVYVKQLDGLVASLPLGVDPDSTIFGNADYGNVRGAELLLEREWQGNWSIRVLYSLQSATATASNAFQLFRRIRLDPVGDTIFPANVEYPLDYDRRHGLITVLRGRIPDGWGPSLAGANLIGGFEAAAVFRYSTGLPYSLTNVTGDTLIGLPNSHRLPPQHTLDLRVRRPFKLGGVLGSLYFDARNALNRRNVEAVRRETGQPGAGEMELLAAARAAYQARPYAIPFESPRYRDWADLDGNGRIEGEAELLPLFERAARDFYQPLFSYGPPRLVRIGFELAF